MIGLVQSETAQCPHTDSQLNALHLSILLHRNGAHKQSWGKLTWGLGVLWGCSHGRGSYSLIKTGMKISKH